MISVEKYTIKGYEIQQENELQPIPDDSEKKI